MADLTLEESTAAGYTDEQIAAVNAERRKRAKESAPGGWSAGDIISMLFFGLLGVGTAGALGASGVFGAGIGAVVQSWINKLTEALGMGPVFDKPMETFLRDAATKPEEFAQLLQNGQFGLGLSEETAKAVAAEGPKFLEVIVAGLQAEGKTIDQLATAPGAMLTSQKVLEAFIRSDLSDGLKEKLIYELIKKQGTPDRPIPESVARTFSKKPHLILNILNETGLDMSKLMEIGTLNMAADDANILLTLANNPDLRKVAKSIPVEDLKSMLGITTTDLDVALNVLRTGDNLDKISKVLNDLTATGQLDMAQVAATIQAVASGQPLSDEAKTMFATLASQHLSLLAPLTSLDMSALPQEQRGMAQASLTNLGHVIAFQEKAQLSPDQLKQFMDQLQQFTGQGTNLGMNEIMSAISTLQVVASKNPEAWKELVGKLDLASYPLPLPEQMLRPMLSGAADLPPVPQRQGSLEVPTLGTTEERALAAVQGIKDGVKLDESGAPLFAQGTGGPAAAIG